MVAPTVRLPVSLRHTIDDIPAELLGAVREETMTELFHLMGKMYEAGEAPSDFKKNVIIQMPAKADADRCESY